MSPSRARIRCAPPRWSTSSPLTTSAWQIIRDPDYDFGTKIFDYAQAGLPVVDYFDGPNDLKRFFAGAFDTDAAAATPCDYSRATMLATNDVASFAWGLEK